MAAFDRDQLRDKILGCWAGKNIGGTVGGPFENKPGPHNVTYYTHKLDGQPLPNDDLDLQLVWLAGIEKYFTPYELTPRIMGDLWHDYIIGQWNEYGACLNNVSHGFYPPLSGVVNNEKWKWSNGAWIRSEIWACCFPGSPDEAIRSAWLDACCDHCGEGIYAEMFTAALESAAFVEDDVQILIDIALARIPENSRVAHAVKLAREYYRDGKTWLETREALLKDSEDLGPFQAPCNIGFVVVGILWGEGDLGKTVCIATNCGDDTDCTAGTAGAVLGIIKGFSNLPEEWIKPIGMGIQTYCITFLGDIWPLFPKTINELTDRVLNIAINTTVYNADLPQIVKGGAGFTQEEREALRIPMSPNHSTDHPTTAELLWEKSSTEFQFEYSWAWVHVCYPDDPEVVPGEPFRLQIYFTRPSNRISDLRVKLRLPEGWVCAGSEQGIYLNSHRRNGDILTFDIIAPETFGCFETVELEIRRNGMLCPEIISLPMQHKGTYTVPKLPEPHRIIEYGRLRACRARRKFE